MAGSTRSICAAGETFFPGNTDAYLRRAVAAQFAIWGPQAEEVVYMSAEKDADGDRLDGNKSAYRLTFDRAPPAKGFWSVTVYDAATRLLVPHPSGRYKLSGRPESRHGARPERISDDPFPARG